jgi:hypothetical protein
MQITHQPKTAGTCRAFDARFDYLVSAVVVDFDVAWSARNKSRAIKRIDFFDFISNSKYGRFDYCFKKLFAARRRPSSGRRVFR